MIATPTFMLLSGAALGLRLATDTALRRLRVELLDRGLFLLTVAHLFIAWSELHRGGSFLQRLAQVNSVDAIGLGCILIAAWGSQLLSNRIATLRIGIVAMLFGWLIALLWHPRNEVSEVLEEISVGDLNNHPVIGYACPLVQYLALYAIGTVLGSKLLSVHRSGKMRPWGLRLVWAGSTAMALAAACHLIATKVAMHLVPDTALMIRETFSAVKLPPSPGYLAFFGGAALVMIGAICSISTMKRMRSAMAWLAVLGRASLFVFILQYFVIWTLPDWLAIHPNAMSPLLFVAEVVLLWTCARAWSAMRGNRFMMFGLRRLIPT